MQMEKCEKLVTKLLLIVLCTAGVAQCYHDSIEDCPTINLSPPDCNGYTGMWGCDDPGNPDPCNYEKLYCNILSINNANKRDKLQCWIEQLHEDITQIQQLYDTSQVAEPMPFPSCADGPVELPYYQFQEAEFFWPPIKQKSCHKLDNTCRHAPCIPRALQVCRACAMVFDVVNDILSNPRYEYVDYADHESCSCCTCEDITSEAVCLSHKKRCPNFTDRTIHTNCFWNSAATECNCCQPSGPCSGTFNYANCQCE